MPDSEDVTRMTLRLPIALYAALFAWAKEDGRSLHGHIIYLLRQLVEERQRGK